MFTRWKKKPGGKKTDVTERGGLSSEVSGSRKKAKRLDEIEQTRQDIMLACLEAAGKAETGNERRSESGISNINNNSSTFGLEAQEVRLLLENTEEVNSNEQGKKQTIVERQKKIVIPD